MNEFLSSFLAQLLATVVGAGVGLAGVVGVFRAERRSAAGDAFEQAVERLLLRVDGLAAAADHWQKIANRSLYREPGDFPPPHPFPGGVSIALELVRLKAPSSEVAMIGRLSEAWDVIAQGTGGELSSACGVFANAIVSWRSGKSLAEIENVLSTARTTAISE